MNMFAVTCYNKTDDLPKRKLLKFTLYNMELISEWDTDNSSKIFLSVRTMWPDFKEPTIYTNLSKCVEETGDGIRKSYRLLNSCSVLKTKNLRNNRSTKTR